MIQKCQYLTAKALLHCDETNAELLFEKSAMQGYIPAYEQIALIYHYNKEHTIKNIKKAINMYKIAIDHNQQNSMNNCALLYMMLGITTL